MTDSSNTENDTDHEETELELRPKPRSRNAVKHGLTADFTSTAWNRSEEQEILATYAKDLTETFKPRNQLEVTLVETLAHDMLRLRRATLMHEGLMNMDSELNPPKSQWFKPDRLNLEEFDRKQEWLNRLKAMLPPLEKLAYRLNNGQPAELTDEEARSAVASMRYVYGLLKRSLRQQSERYEIAIASLDLRNKEDRENKEYMEEELEKELKEKQKPIKPFKDIQIHDSRRVLKALVSTRCFPKTGLIKWQRTSSATLQGIKDEIQLAEAQLRHTLHLRESKAMTQLENLANIELIDRYESRARRNIEKNLVMLRGLRQMMPDPD